MGAVYESLLSYQGFYAEEDLYEVKKEGEKRDELETAWFVPGRELDKYTDGEKVFERDEEGRSKLLKYPKGKFIYRRTGRSRESSASYYTPESLTRLVVKYALKERIKEDMPAKEILELTVCEPAMGSGAFLTEAVNQLAESTMANRSERQRWDGAGFRNPCSPTLGPCSFPRLYRPSGSAYLSSSSMREVVGERPASPAAAG